MPVVLKSASVVLYTATVLESAESYGLHVSAP